jgi:hypothetical protein
VLVFNENWSVKIAAGSVILMPPEITSLGFPNRKE